MIIQLAVKCRGEDWHIRVRLPEGGHALRSREETDHLDLDRPVQLESCDCGTQGICRCEHRIDNDGLALADGRRAVEARRVEAQVRAE